MAMLAALATLELPDAWIAAGAIRNAVWDSLHGFSRSTPLNDVDVIWFGAGLPDPSFDILLERRLRALLPGVPWQVKNQARMHLRNGDAPYRDSVDAMRYWTETATAVAAGLNIDGGLEIAAPLGLDDLVGLAVRPVPRSRGDIATSEERIVSKRWLDLWPRLGLVDAAGTHDDPSGDSMAGKEPTI